MKEILRFGDLMLLSDLAVREGRGSHVVFEDGSEADLENRTLVNVGAGQMVFVDVPNVTGEARHSQVFAAAHSVHLEGGELYFELLPSPDDAVHMEVLGTPGFVQRTRAEWHGGRLSVAFPANEASVVIGDVYVNGRRVAPDPDPGMVRLLVPPLARLTVRATGQARGWAGVPIGELVQDSRGSGHLTCLDVGQADLDITGSGHVILLHVQRACSMDIRGSGTVQVMSGVLSNIRVALQGSGTVIANVVAHEAELSVTGSGSIVIAEVGRATQQHGGSGVLLVQRRSRTDSA